MIGSEKEAFFADPAVKKEFERNGLKVEVDPAGSRQIATSVDLGEYDFVFPSSAPAADRILRIRGTTARYSPFASPMVIATFQPIAGLLAREGVVRNGSVFDFAKYLGLVARHRRWDQLANNTAYPVRKDILVSTTDPRSSNSAAMYLAIASYVANGDRVVTDAAQERKALPTLAGLFVDQGYTDNTSEGPFGDYLALGMGNTPLVCAYEAQFVDAAVRGRLKPGMVLLYPSPTVQSKHTLIPFDDKGDKVGHLLTSDPAFQRLAAVHGFRTTDPAQFAKVAAGHHVPVRADLIDVADTPSYDTLEHLLDGVAEAYG
ncbi:hypothetical protein [Actinomadura nitritigenes]|uniref:hypothetical protein n=1 Tax=Actinomadura nitritigenes TaxID=134602 RepID=UPI003D90BFFD